MVDPVERDSRGILHPRAGLERFSLDRFEPSASTARFVDRYWVVSWDLPDGQHYDQRVLVHPVVNVVFDSSAEDPDPVVSGIAEKAFGRRIRGRGRALGIMFRPAGFRPFLGRSMATISGAVLPASTVLPSLTAIAPEVCADLAAPDGPASDAPGPRVSDSQLSGSRLSRSRVPVAGSAVSGSPVSGLDSSGWEVAAKEIAATVDTALAELIAAVVPAGRQPSEVTTEWAELAATDRTIQRVEQLAAAAGTSVRQLQRAFTDHVGIGPKRLIRRYRLYEAAERASRDEEVDWAVLAADLGYADQAHLTREFTALVGQPPARYSREERSHSTDSPPGSAGPGDGDPPGR